MIRVLARTPSSAKRTAPNTGRPWSREEMRAAQRLKELGNIFSVLRGLRAASEVDIGDLLRVAANCLFALEGNGWLTPSPTCLRGQVPPGLHASDVEIAAALAHRNSGRLMPARRAGELIGFSPQEHQACRKAGVVVRTFAPVETAGERADRIREQTRKRVARHRRTKAKQSSNSVTTCNVAGYVTPYPTDRQRYNAATLKTTAERIVSAVEGGAVRLEQVVEATGIAASTIKPWLSRLVSRGLIKRTGRGLYRAVAR